MPAFGYGGSYQAPGAEQIQGTPGSRAAYQALQTASVNQRAFGIDPTRTNENLQLGGGGLQGGFFGERIYSPVTVSDPSSPYASGAMGNLGMWANPFQEQRISRVVDGQRFYENIPGQPALGQPGFDPLRRWDETLAAQKASPAGLLQTKTGLKQASIEDAIGDYQRYLTAYNELQKRGVGAFQMGGYSPSARIWTPEGRRAVEENWNRFSQAVMPRYVQQGNLTFSSGRQV